MKREEFKDADAPATKRQTYAIFCLSKEDVRDFGLTRWEASQMIGDLKAGKKFELPERVRLDLDKVAEGLWDKVEKPFTVKAVLKEKKSWKKIFLAAIEAGKKTMEICKPTPMVVQEHVNQLDDNSPVKREWFVPGGACGFAWVNIPCKGNGLKFINALKKEGLAGSDNFSCPITKDNYRGGYVYWVHEGGQSIEYKTAFARGFARVLEENGITCHVGSRLD